MKEKKNKKSKIIKGMALLGLFLLVFGVSYALFSITLNGTKRNRITTGNLSLVLLNESGNALTDDTVGLENAVPITNEEGMNTTPYIFTLKNNGTISAEYSIKLEDIPLAEGEERLLDNNIKTFLEITDEEGNKVADKPILLSTIEDRILDAGVLEKGKERHYKLYTWLDYGATTASAANKVFDTRLKIDGTQVTKETDSKTILKRISIDHVKENINNPRPTGVSSATIYKDGTLVVHDGIRTSTFSSKEIKARFSDEKIYIAFKKRMITAAGYDASGINTIDDLISFDNDPSYEAEDGYSEELTKVINEMFTNLGLESPGEVWELSEIEAIALEYINNGDVETGEKILEKLLELTGDYYSYGIKKVIYTSESPKFSLCDMLNVRTVTLSDGATQTPRIQNLSLLETINIPSSVKYINPLSDCSRIKKIEIPANAKPMSNNPMIFSNLTENTEIIFNNTEEEINTLWQIPWKEYCKAKITYKTN